MSKNLDFPGGIGEIQIDDVGTFDESAADNPSSFLVTIGEDVIADEGNDIPAAEAITSALANDKEFRMGLNQELNLRLASLAMSDFDTLEDQVVDGSTVFVKVISKATYSDGTPKFEVVYQEVILSNVVHDVVNASRDSYGGVVISGMTTGYRSDDIYSLTINSAP
jgi:hypothetical protein